MSDASKIASKNRSFHTVLANRDAMACFMASTSERRTASVNLLTSAEVFDIQIN
jgi:hypothetical protein